MSASLCYPGLYAHRVVIARRHIDRRARTFLALTQELVDVVVVEESQLSIEYLLRLLGLSWLTCGQVLNRKRVLHVRFPDSELEMYVVRVQTEAREAVSASGLGRPRWLGRTLIRLIAVYGARSDQERGEPLVLVLLLVQ